MAAIDEQFQQDLNNRMDYLIQQVLTLKKRVDAFMDEMERRDKETVEYCRKEMKKAGAEIISMKEVTSFPPTKTKRPGFTYPREERHENKIPA